MKRYTNNQYGVWVIYGIWLVALVILLKVASVSIPVRQGYLGPLPFANFDGVHYLSIAKSGYFQYEQAFFPLYPLLIRRLSFLPIQPVFLGLSISQISLVGALYFLLRLMRRIGYTHELWAVAFLLFFPTGFFFASVYTESFFLFLSVVALAGAYEEKWWLAGIAGMFASATRLFGIFLFPMIAFELWKQTKGRPRVVSVLWVSCIPVGLLFYMWYLWQTVGDPFFFFHVQPAFGAGRSGSTLIFLPQVIWRYVKIFVTANPVTISYTVAVFEFLTLLLALSGLFVGITRRVISWPLAFYSLGIVLVPTLTGTLSSLPRYVLSAFPLFFVLGSMHNRLVKSLLLALCALGFFVAGVYFLQGYFVS